MNTDELKKLAEAALDKTVDIRMWDVLGDYYEAANPAAILELLAINAELVEALKGCISEAEYIGSDGWMTGGMHSNEYKAAIAALAKAEGAKS